MALLEAQDITKRFPGVVALGGASLRVEPGEVHALLGENGAGKSTLLKILAGAQGSDGGQLTFDEKPLRPDDTPSQRQKAGIVTIYQEFNLQPFLSVAENLYLGREPLRMGLIDHRQMRADARRILDDLGLSLDPNLEVSRLNVADQQMVEIARAMTLQAKLIIMDEPTAALSPREVDILHRIVGTLKARGIAVIYVTHRLKEVKAICDAYTVLRDGRFVASGQVSDVSIDDMVRLMIGRDVAFLKRPPRQVAPTPVLRIDGVSRRRGAHEARGTSLDNISFEVHAGEIVGLAGLVGAGRTDLARVLYGADRKDSGRIHLCGRALDIQSPAQALSAGIALVPEDRKQQGCFLDHSIRHNLSLSALKALSRPGGFVDEGAERRLVETFRQKLRIRMSSPEAAIGTLSGGNQQKVLLARCMALSPKVLIVDEPTRGIDVGAKADVHQVLFDMAAEGMAVIVISSELPEVMAVSDRIIVFREGRITGTLEAADADEETLMALMATGSAPQASNP